MEQRWSHAGRGLLAAGIVALLIAAGLVAFNYRLLLGHADARGDVVSVERRSVAGGTLYAPVVRFQTAAGMTVFKGRFTSVPFEVGDGVDIVYDPHQPEKARVDGPLSLWLPVIAALVCGVLFGSIGAVLIVALRREEASAESVAR